MDKKFWAAVFTLTGTIIGSGILGLPYIFSQAGWLIGVFWVLLLGGIVLYVLLCLGEITLRTKKYHQLPGYAKKYLGKKGGRIMFFAMTLGIYTALLAYLIGEGQSLSQLFTGGANYSLYFGIGFWFLMVLFLQEGLEGLKRIESFGVSGIILIILFILFYYSRDIQVSNLVFMNYSKFFIPMGVVLFAYLGFTSIPEMRRELKKDEHKMKKAITIGLLIPVFIYLFFTFVFVGVLGKDMLEVATLNFGILLTIFGILTMLTSYFVLSFALKDMFKYDLKFHRFWVFVFVSVIPLLLYVLISVFNLMGFVTIMGVGGAITLGLKGILILIINHKAKEKGDRNPEYSVSMNWFFSFILILIFLFGIIFELFYF